MSGGALVLGTTPIGSAEVHDRTSLRPSSITRFHTVQTPATHTYHHTRTRTRTYTTPTQPVSCLGAECSAAHKGDKSRAQRLRD